MEENKNHIDFEENKPYLAPHNPFSLEGHWQPWYDDRRDYSTNAPSYYEYLANFNKLTKDITTLLNRVAARNVTTEDTNTIVMTKLNDWILNDDKSFSDIITLKAHTKLSRFVAEHDFDARRFDLDNALTEKTDGVYSKDYLPLIEHVNSKVDTETANRTKKDDEINSRLTTEIRNVNDRLTNAFSDTTPNPEEVVDARLGLNNATYKSLGDAIRVGDRTNLKLVDNIYKSSGYYIKRDGKYRAGGYNSDGSYSADVQYKMNYTFNVKEGQIFKYSLIQNQYNLNWVMLDDSDTVIYKAQPSQQQSNGQVQTEELVIPSKVTKLIITSPTDATSRNAFKVEEYVYSRDFNLTDTIINLFKDFNAWGNITPENIAKTNGIYTVTTSNRNAGIVSNKFTSNDSKVVIKVKGHKTIDYVGVHVQYQDKAGATHIEFLGRISENTFETSFTFDPASLVVYKNANSETFQVILNAISDSPTEGFTGTFTIEDIEINSLDALQQSELYSQKLRELLNNITAKISEIETSTNTEKVILTSPSNQKFQLIVSDNGELTAKRLNYQKVLYLGNSLLLGSNTDGEHGRPFGLAATSFDESYQAKLNKLLNITDYTCKHDAVFEQCINDSDAISYINTLDSVMTHDTDLVIVQIGDNVNTEARYNTFIKNFDLLIKKIKSINANTTIVIAGAWFDSYNLTPWFSDYARLNNVLFTNLNALNTKENMGIAGAIQTCDDGTQIVIQSAWATHPGDKGFTAIANAIYKTIN